VPGNALIAEVGTGPNFSDFHDKSGVETESVYNFESMPEKHFMVYLNGAEDLRYLGIQTTAVVCHAITRLEPQIVMNSIWG
jgi:hypothetical protein